MRNLHRTPRGSRYMFNTTYIDFKVHTHVYIGIERERGMSSVIATQPTQNAKGAQVHV